MQRNLRVRLRESLQHRSGFIKIASVAFGVPSAVVLLWMFGSYGGVGWWLFLVALTIPAAWGWAYFMWLASARNIRRGSADATAQKVNE